MGWILAPTILLVLSACQSAPSDRLFFAKTGDGAFAGDWIVIPSDGMYIHYTGSGRCESLGFRFVSPTSAADNLDTPPPAGAGPDTRGSWYLSIRHGLYALSGGAVGCSWTVTIREWWGLPGLGPEV
jgi:hypothetical protein